MDIIAHLATPLDIKVLLDVAKKTCAIISIRSLAGKIQCFQQNWPVISSRKVRKLQNVRKSTKICNPNQTFSSLLSKHKLQTGATRPHPNRQYSCHWICCRKICKILFFRLLTNQSDLDCAYFTIEVEADVDWFGRNKLSMIVIWFGADRSRWILHWIVSKWLTFKNFVQQC